MTRSSAVASGLVGASGWSCAQQLHVDLVELEVLDRVEELTRVACRAFSSMSRPVITMVMVLR